MIRSERNTDGTYRLGVRTGTGVETVFPSEDEVPFDPYDQHYIWAEVYDYPTPDGIAAYQIMHVGRSPVGAQPQDDIYPELTVARRKRCLHEAFTRWINARGIAT